MSQWNFNARCELAATSSAQEWFVLLAAAKTTTDITEQNKILLELNAGMAVDGILESSYLNKMELELSGDDLVMNIEAGSELSYAFFDSLIEHFDELGVTHYRARLYDSSSNSLKSWVQPEIDLVWQEKMVCIVGIDEEEGIHDALKEQGAVLVDIDATNVDVVVFGDDISLDVANGMMAKTVAKSLDTIFIAEEDVWDFLEEAFG